jgi:two-component sensor histidine kinase
MNELNHRANNLLTVVQALAHQTANSADAKAFARRLTQRITGLAASNSLLISGKWQGVELTTLVCSQLAPFVVDLDRRVVVTGPLLRLAPAAAQAVGMALHELATNAVKHGALAGNGTIRVEWSIEERAGHDVFGMAWLEEGGPRRHAPALRLRPHGDRAHDRPGAGGHGEPRLRARRHRLAFHLPGGSCSRGRRRLS